MSNGFIDEPPRLPSRPEFTGRSLVLGHRANDAGLPRMLRDKAGLTLASFSDFPAGSADLARFGGADGIYLERLGVAITAGTPEQHGRLSAPAAGTDRLIVEREQVVYLFQVPARPNPSVSQPSHSTPVGPTAVHDAVCSRAPGTFAAYRLTDEEAAHTWGLASTKVLATSRTGRGIRVAVLDTGFDLSHPDFAGRTIVSRSFVDGEEAHDGHGHGTHCIGTALGTAQPPVLPRYGVASGADIYVGKVMNNAGNGRTGSILAGIEWALTQGCRIVSMSLGTSTERGTPHSQVYEAVAQRALAANTLLIAAAGNESDRNENIVNPVGSPANCPSVMAVGGIDVDLRIYNRSTRGLEPNGGGIDIVAPAVNVYSTTPMPGRHGRKSGTSMACPHVAGIAALYMEAHPTATAREIWQLLTANAKSLALDAADIGAGLVQAPA